MKNLTVFASLAALFAISALCRAQLNPPPGAVQPTDRTRINQQSITSFPRVISVSGSYILTSNIVVPPGFDGFVINTDDVSLDLNGFRIVGSPGAGQTSAIRTNTVHRRISVMNGGVFNWTGSGIDLWSTEQARIIGVRAQSCATNGSIPTLHAGISVGVQALIEGCTSSFNSYNGVVAGDQAVVRGCTARMNQRSGIEAQNGATVSDSTSSSNGYRGFLIMSNARITGCTANDNGFGSFGAGCGIQTNEFAVITACAAGSNADSGFIATSRSTFDNCTAHYNGNCGIVAGYGTVVRGCVTNDNGAAGDERESNQGPLCSPLADHAIRNITPAHDDSASRSEARGVFSNDGISLGDGSSVLDSVAQGNADDGIAVYFGSIVSRCVARFNRDADISMDYGEGSILDCMSEYSYGYGIRVGDKAKVRGCTVNRATTDGISAAGECEIVGNTVTQCGFSGINVYAPRTRVHDNQATFNQTGFAINGPNCIVTSNRASANLFNYALNPAGVQGQIMNMMFGGTIPFNDPWMNLEY